MAQRMISTDRRGKEHTYIRFYVPTTVFQFKLLTICLLAALVAAPARADGDAEAAAGTVSRWLVVPKIGVGEVSIENIRHDGTIGTGEIIGGELDGQIREGSVRDHPWGIGGSLVRRFGNWDVEAELMWRFRTDWDIAVATPSIQTITNVFTNIETTTLMFNVIRHGRINRRWSWEAGGGLGWVLTRMDSEYIEREVPDIAPSARIAPPSVMSGAARFAMAA